MEIPFVNLKKQYLSIKKEIDEAINNVIQNTAFVLGDVVKKFEDDFASFCSVKYCRGVSSGTSALQLALMSLDIKKGDEIILPPNTYIATAEAVSAVNAKPVFVDVDPETYNIDPKLIKENITDKTKAIIPVHLYGQPADMNPILEIAQEKNLFVVEDACQAHGAEYKGRKCGSIGAVGGFSFYPGKNLGAFGEGGAITTNNEEIAKKIEMLRDHGQAKKHHHEVIGTNSRLEGIQGAVLGAKLKYLSEWNNKRRKNAKYYNERLSNLDKIKTPVESEYGKHIYHLYIIQIDKRDELQKFLKSKGIATGLHYPTPIHLQPAYSHLGLTKDLFPITESYVKKILSLPMFPELEKEEIDFVVDSIADFLKNNF